jgi:hypothetical protein
VQQAYQGLGRFLRQARIDIDFDIDFDVDLGLPPQSANKRAPAIYRRGRMGRIRPGIAASTALIVFFQVIPPALAHRAAVLEVAQAGSAAAPATSPDATPNAALDKTPPATAPAPEPAPKAKPLKSILAVPACSMRYAAAKISGKLNGRKWSEFRREECGEKQEVKAMFPETIAPKYAGENPDQARTHTCADRFTANKADNANGGMKWIDKDGGYYAECVSRLKD